MMEEKPAGDASNGFLDSTTTEKPFVIPPNKPYFSLISLYGTCFLAFGSYLMNSSFSGVVRLFLDVV